MRSAKYRVQCGRTQSRTRSPIVHSTLPFSVKCFFNFGDVQVVSFLLLLLLSFLICLCSVYLQHSLTLTSIPLQVISMLQNIFPKSLSGLSKKVPWTDRETQEPNDLSPGKVLVSSVVLTFIFLLVTPIPLALTHIPMNWLRSKVKLLLKYNVFVLDVNIPASPT